MKMNAFLGLAGTALFVNSYSNSHTPIPAPTPDGYISIDTANKMIGSYLSSLSPDSTRSSPHIRSFILNADLLRDYLSDTSIRQVKVALSHTLNYINSGHQGEYAGDNTDAVTIIIAGYDNEKNYVFRQNNMVPNHAMPCPRNCPQVGTASGDLLQ